MLLNEELPSFDARARHVLPDVREVCWGNGAVRAALGKPSGLAV